MMLDLPWPDRHLHPNARLHWAQKAKATSQARQDAAWSAMAAGIRTLNADALHVTLTFCAPDKRRRDLDGLLSSMKAHLDGIADATGVDDSNWSIAIKRGDIVKGGLVRVEIEEIAA